MGSPWHGSFRSEERNMTTLLRSNKLVFIGAGNMAEALVKGILATGLRRPGDVAVTDVMPDRLKYFKERFGVDAIEDNALAVKDAGTVVMAVKPQMFVKAAEQVRDSILHDALVVSIAAGIPIRRIETMFLPGTAVVRVMPNMPALVGCGATAFCLGRNAREADAETTGTLFKSVGQVVRLEERLMDAVTALSGSGPAYVFYLAEAMIRAGVEMGMDAETARQLTVATVEGAGRLMADTKLPPSELRQKVTSKGGTTAAALQVMAQGHLDEIAVAAIHAAQARANELSNA